MTAIERRPATGADLPEIITPRPVRPRPPAAAAPGSELRRAAESLLSGVSAAAGSQALPDLVRLTGAMIWRTNKWGVTTGLRLGNTLLRGALSGQSAQSVAEEIGAEAKQAVRDMLGVTDPDPMPQALRERIPVNGHTPSSPEITLPDRMRALLDASSDLTYPDGGHPAYVRVLSELAPDEARVLRLFAERGPQAAVDVRTRKPFGVGSELVEPGLTMIGRYAGCRHTERVPAYLNNLFRLGLVWFSREALPEQSVYDVLEAQDEVQEAMQRAGRGITVRRSIELTAFGRNLCAMTGLLSRAQRNSPADDEQIDKALPPPDAR
jgi:hypothetical protein